MQPLHEHDVPAYLGGDPLHGSGESLQDPKFVAVPQIQREDPVRSRTGLGLCPVRTHRLPLLLRKRQFPPPVLQQPLPDAFRAIIPAEPPEDEEVLRTGWTQCRTFRRSAVPVPDPELIAHLLQVPVEFPLREGGRHRPVYVLPDQAANGGLSVLFREMLPIILLSSFAAVFNY